MITEFLTVVMLSIWIVKPVNASGSNTIGVSTSCFPTYIQISLLRESFPGVNMSALYLRNPWCKPSKNSTHVTFKAPLYGCKTHLVEIHGYYAFDNVVQGVSPSIEVRCFYNNKHHTGSGNEEKWHDSIKITAELNLYRDSKLSRPVPPGEAVRFELPKPRDLIFDLRIIPNQKDVRVCLFVKFCGLFFEDKVLSLIENGQENKMTTRMLFTSPQRITFRFNASILLTSINLNTKLKAFCTVNGYHERKTQDVITNNVKKDCNGKHGDNHHGNASDSQESKEGPDSKELSRNSTHCNCEQKGLPEANGKVNQTRAGCGGSCVNGSKVNNGTSYSSRDRNLRRKREVKDQGLLGIVSRENNNTFGLKHDNGSSNNQDSVSNYISKNKHGCNCREQCSSAKWNGKPVSLLLEREWTAKPSIPKRDLTWFEKYDVRHAPQTIKNGVNSTVLAQAVESREERISSPALLLACLYLSLLLVIGPVLSVYLWDRRNQKKRRRHKQRI